MRNIHPIAKTTFAGSEEHNSNSLPFSALLSALSFALDLTEKRPMGHVLRSCMLGMRIGKKIHLPEVSLANLYYALLLKDVGSSGDCLHMYEIANLKSPKTQYGFSLRECPDIEWGQLQHPIEQEHDNQHQIKQSNQVPNLADNLLFPVDEFIRRRCERAAHVSRDLGLPREVSEAVSQADERWDGSGFPNNLRGEQISLLARIINVAQALDIAAERYGRSSAIDIISRRCSSWFDIDLVEAVNLLHDQYDLWEDLQSSEILTQVIALEPEHLKLNTERFTIDNICLAFAEIVDAKSPFTFTHSTGVAKVAVSIAQVMGQDKNSIKLLQRAALVHDIGKLSVPNSILGKNGSLTPFEWSYIHQHPRYTKEILDKLPGFEEIATIAAAHHEMLDGSGYPYGLTASELPLIARILTIADIYDALSSVRPYRPKLKGVHIFNIMRREAPHSLDPRCLDALEIVMRHDYSKERRGDDRESSKYNVEA